MKHSGTEFVFVGGEKGRIEADVLLIPLSAKPQPPLELIARVDRLCDDAVSELLAVRPLSESVGQLAHTTGTATCRRIVTVSLGEEAQLDAAQVRHAAGAAARWLISERIRTAAVWLDGLALTRVPSAVAEWVLGLSIAGFRFDTYKARDAKTPGRVRIELRASESGLITRAQRPVREATQLAAAINYARRLAHEPANICNPATLAAEARLLARQHHLKCTVLEAPRLKQLKLHGLLAVGGGAAHAPRLIQVEYRGALRARATTVLVGKAITFDTGGYSIKPAAGLEQLKFDKCGGVTVLGILKAVAELKLKCNVIGVIPAAENAISAQAYRPGDILAMMSGKTVEVTNTDAEGRLILADALWYAQTHLKPTALIDLATLTGGARLALGTAAAALMSTNDNLAAELGEAGRNTHERLWRLPLWDDYRELLKSTEADLKNSAGKRDAHCIQGGMFLKEFIKPGTPWAHIDIAAVAALENGNGATPKGATGFGIRLIVEYLRRGGTHAEA